MAITLYYFAPSPYSRAVQIVIGILKLDANYKSVDIVKGENKSDWYVELYPRKQIPFMVDGEVKIGESRAINAYLVEKYAKNDFLYPRDPAIRAKVNEFLYFDATALANSNHGRISEIRGVEYTEEMKKRYKETMTIADNYVKNKKFLVGDNFTLADISFACSISMLTILEIDISEYQNIVKYMDGISKTVPNFESLAANAKAICKEVFLSGKK